MTRKVQQLTTASLYRAQLYLADIDGAVPTYDSIERHHRWKWNDQTNKEAFDIIARLMQEINNTRPDV